MEKATTTPDFPTWKILSDGGNGFHWSFSSSESVAVSAQNPPSCLPSMSDLLLQESSRIAGSDGSSIPMFRTGAGKPVAVKESSMRKALSVLGEGEISDRGPYHITGESNDDGTPMFKTGSGKSVMVKQSSIRKALSVLGGGDVFERGSGKVVNVSSDGLIRAKALLGLENYSPCASYSSKERKKHSDANGFNGWGVHCLEEDAGVILGTHGMHNGPLDPCSLPKCPISSQQNDYQSDLVNQLHEDVFPNLLESDIRGSSPQEPQVKFQTAGGRSISVSSDALQRAKSLLGETEFGSPPNKGSIHDPMCLFLRNENTHDATLHDNGGVPHLSPLYQDAMVNWHSLNKFQPHKESFFKEKPKSFLREGINSGIDILKHVDANDLASEGIYKSNRKPPRNDLHAANHLVENPSIKDPASRIISHGRLSGKPLVEISNIIEETHADPKKITSEKRKLGWKSSISPFKRPRSSRFSTPFNSNISLPPTGSSTSKSSCWNKNVSTRYPFRVKRLMMKEFFGGPPYATNSFIHLSNEVKYMNADSAEKYMFHFASGLGGIGAEALREKLAQFGASLIHASKEWVANHYKWIVWKLACLERCYPSQARGKFLTVPNVLEELKYRYEREENHGHRSAVKRILEGDASAASMVVLCISAIRAYSDPEPDKVECCLAPYQDPKKAAASSGTTNCCAAKIELTDGWYSLDAYLDGPLSNQLAARKLFVGQKLRIWGAGLRGWVAPVSPLEEAKTVSLVIHINGTYRAHWADRLGFCKGIGAPLSFRCIKSAGGPVPRTLIGVARIYPILYGERLADGGFVVRSERVETRLLQLYNQRRSNIAEGILFDTQKENFGCPSNNDSDSEEGAKICKLLEMTAEPEVLMADMSTEQLNSFATYQAKQEAIRLSDTHKNLEKALNDAGLGERQITPLMRVRVVGLTDKCSQRKGHTREGLITIWNPTENQKAMLVEGKVYCIGGLVPLYTHSNVIHLQTKGSTTTWQPLPPSAVERFEPFFKPRKSILLSNLGEVPLASEFDMAAVIVHVGDLYLSGNQKKQWVFVADGSETWSEFQQGPSICLLAVCFSSSINGDDTFAPVEPYIAGSTVAFCNLIKQPRDTVNDLWVAEATENSACYFDSCPYSCSHLKEAIGAASKWAKISSFTLQKLKERILSIIGGSKS